MNDVALPAGRRLSGRGIEFCRVCGSIEMDMILSLGEHPPANRLLSRVDEFVPLAPLDLRVCRACGLGQIGEFSTPEEVFRDYPYRSSISHGWRAHLEKLVDNLDDLVDLSPGDDVLEIGCNDGLTVELLAKRGFRVVGVDPHSSALASERRRFGKFLDGFFCLDMARTLKNQFPDNRYKLILANNVLAHVPDPVDFLVGIRLLCEPDTVVLIENQSFTNLVDLCQFDTVYHEHYSYISATSMKTLAEKADLNYFNVQPINTHGGSLRHFLTPNFKVKPYPISVETLQFEGNWGILATERYNTFAEEVRIRRRMIERFLEIQSHKSRTVVGYGAAAKTTTVLNSIGASGKTIDYVADKNPSKQGKFIPGTFSKVVSLEEVQDTRIDNFLVFSWNWISEIAQDLGRRVPNAHIWTTADGVSRVI